LSGLVALALFVGVQALLKLPEEPESGFVPDYSGGKLDRRNSITVLRLAGTPEEKGRAHGRLLKEQVRARIAKLKPRDPGVADFAIRTCGERMLPALPAALREEIEGIAEGAGVTTLEVLFLNTHYEVSAHVGGGEDPSMYRGEAAVGDGPEVLRCLRPTDGDLFGDLVIVVHEDTTPCLVLVALPGLVGGLAALRGPVGAAIRPIPTLTKPVLTGVAWPLLLRLLVEAPPKTGDQLPAPAARAVSVPLRRSDGSVGTLNLSPAGGTWYPGFLGLAMATEEPVTGLGGRILAAATTRTQRLMAGENARRLLTRETPPGVLEARLKGGRNGVQVTLALGPNRLRRVVRFRE